MAVKASKYVTRRTAKPVPNQKLAIVFDIDETTLSNLSMIQGNGFGYNPKLWNEWINEGRAPAILPVQALYETAVRHGVSVFFITSRLESTRAATERNLRTVGYDAWANVFLRTKEDLRTTRQYKTGARQEIEAAGYILSPTSATRTATSPAATPSASSSCRIRSISCTERPV
ncbi:MAG: HAD family acid phosphatase [Lacunisphaera sp.]